MGWGNVGAGSTTAVTPNKGFWNASTNSPDYISTITQEGDFLITSTAGTQNISGLGSTSFTIGDYLVRTAAGYMHIDANDNSIDLSGIADGTLLRVNGTVLGASSLVEDSDSIDASKTIRTEFSSLQIGPAVTFREIGGEPEITSNVTNNKYTSVAYPVSQSNQLTDENRPFYFELGSIESDFQIQGTNSTEMTVTSFDITPTFSYQNDSFKLDVVNALSNFRIRVTSLATSEVIRFFPSEGHWKAGTGISLSPGQVEVFRQGTEIGGLEQTALRFINGVNYRVEYMADQPVVLRGDGTTPWLVGDIRRTTLRSVLNLEDLSQNRFELTSNLTINSSNYEMYNRGILFTPTTQSSEISITISSGLTNIEFFDVCVLGSAALRVLTQGAERVNGETDIRFTNLEGGRIKQVENGQYSLIFDNTDPDMTDDYIDNARLDGNNLILENANTNIADLSVDLSSLQSTGVSVFSTIRTFSTQTGNFDITSLGNDLIFTGTQITGLTLSDTSIPDNTVFAIANEKTTDIIFDLHTSGLSFQGFTSGATTFTIPSGQTVVFYKRLTSVYEWANYNTASGAGGTSDHPVVLTRDTPSLADLNSLAQASLNDNSALWVIASDQVVANENTVDSSIMIRALEAGLLDANGAELSTTSVQKRTVVLSGGTIVRIFSNTDLRVVSAPSPGAMRQLYPDIPFTGAVRLEESDEGLYNSYVRRTATNAGGSNQYIALPDLHTSNRPSWVREGDVFVMRHTGTTTGTQRPHLRPDNTGDNIAGHGLRYYADPGQTIAVQAPRFGVRTWQLFPVAQMSDGNTYYNPEIVLPDHFYVDDTGSIAADNSLRLHYNREIVEGVVRDHISEATATNNPAQLWFQSRDIQDDIAWIQYFSALGAAVPPLGATAAEIEANVPTALTWIQNNVSNSFDFTINDPSVTHAISYLTHQANQTIKIGIDTALPTHIVLNDVINISGNSFAGNNGDWAITQIYPDRLAFDITIPGSSSANNTGASGTITRNLYGRSTLVADDIRVHTFNLYRNIARNNPVTSYLSDWYDIDSDTTPPYSVLSIGYNTDIQTTGSQVAVQDEAGDFFSILGGPRHSISFVDNRTSYTSSGLNLPVNHPIIHIDTLGINTFYIPEYPSQLNSGEARRYSLHSLPVNDRNDVTIRIGESGSNQYVDFDEGISAFDIPNGSIQTIELYNDGNDSGVRIISPFEKIVPSFIVNTTPTSVTSGLQNMDITEINLSVTEDPNRRFYTILNDKFVLEGAFKYTLQYNLDLIFNGNEDTGLSFVNVELVPTLTRGGSTNDIRHSRGATTGTLFFIRNGNNNNDDTKPRIGLNCEVTVISQADDEVGFDLRFGTFPSGYSIGNITKQNIQYSLIVKGGLD